MPTGDVAINLDSPEEFAAGGGVFAFVSVKKGQVDGPLEAVMCQKSILEVIILHSLFFL
jgi:hypothetical protein